MKGIFQPVLTALTIRDLLLGSGMEIWDIYDCNREKTERSHERGKPMLAGDYHIVVRIWIQNSKGLFLVTKRTPNKEHPNLWECTGGAAVAGDTSLDAALREVKEETGLTLDPPKWSDYFNIQMGQLSFT